ncbi:MAG: rhodanese-like domain-containing protein [Flavobacteriales bacterium]|nr:rhodanese-like domain-containing protein [Flavobacteriales bacterium]MBP9079529.1 rhodanese-like domain-containing protein [Flavobacteriales bacterium]
MNNKTVSFLSLAVIGMIAMACQAFSPDQGHDPWTAQQLMPPAELAKQIKEGKAAEFHVFNIGPSGAILGSVEIGEGRDSGNIAKLKTRLSELPKDANVVVYCGCCPFKNCPNVRPAMKLINEMQFTNGKLLDLRENLKVDWIDQGYPMAD